MYTFCSYSIVVVSISQYLGLGKLFTNQSSGFILVNWMVRPLQVGNSVAELLNHLGFSTKIFSFPTTLTSVFHALIISNEVCQTMLRFVDIKNSIFLSFVMHLKLNSLPFQSCFLFIYKNVIAVFPISRHFIDYILLALRCLLPFYRETIH